MYVCVCVTVTVSVQWFHHCISHILYVHHEKQVDAIHIYNIYIYFCISWETKAVKEKKIAYFEPSLSLSENQIMSKPTLEGHEKPRKLEDDTAVYLAQMDVEFDKIPLDDIESRSVLVENVIREVEHRLASASCDRRTNFIIEKLVTDGSLEILVECMKKCKEYVVFLARNRFASHIVQSMLARLTYLLKDQPQAEEENPTLVETIIAFCAPLLHDMHWLSQEQCSSHVLRSVACLLAGVPPVAEKKTKKAKHQHSVTYSLTLDELVVPGTFCIAHRFSITVPQRFKEVLLQYCTQLYEKKSAHDLQLLVANVSSNAYLVLLLRVLGCPERFVDSEGFILAQNITLKIMELSHPSEYEPESLIPSSTFFGMAGDRCGSYFLEAVISSLDRNLFFGLIRANVLGSVDSYLQDTTSNFVLQAIIRRLEYELSQFVTKRSISTDEEPSSKKRKESKSSLIEDSLKSYVIRTVVEFFEEVLQSINEAEDFESKKRTWQERGGVLLSILFCSLALRRVDTSDRDQSHKDFAVRFANLVLFTWTSASFADGGKCILSGDYQEKEFIAEAARYLSHRITAPVVAAAASAEDEADCRNNVGDKGKKPAASAAINKGGYVDMSSQLLLCRLLGTLLTFPVLKISLQAASIVTSLDVAALKVVSTTGNMSKSLFDTYLQFFAPSSNSDTEAAPQSSVAGAELPSVSQQAQMTKQLSVALSQLAAELAGHFVGQHIVKRVFELSDIRGKERWVQVLSAPVVMAGLMRTKEGRNSLQLVQAEAYQRDSGEWRNMMKKQMKASELFKDLFGSEKAAGVAVVSKEESKISNDKAAKPTKKEDKIAKMDVDVGTLEGDEDDEEEDNGEEGGNTAATSGKRKRKRKRTGNKNKTTAV